MGTTACFERWHNFHPALAVVSSMMTASGSLALVNRAKRTTRRGDIESELYCSAREACTGCLPSLGSEFGKAAVVVCRDYYSPDDGTKT